MLKDKPPVYRWDRVECLAFISGCLFFALMILGCLLAVPGFDEFLLFFIGVFCAWHFWPQIPQLPARYREWQRMKDELRVFREEIEEHERK